MNKKAIFSFFLCFLLLLAIPDLIADQRVENIEIYLVLDKSLSMVEEIEAVKDYVIEQILERIVIKGDYFLLIPFYGHTDNSFNGYITSKAELDDLQSKIENIQADGRFTDIGNALNTLRSNIKTDNESARKYMLLITDGKQEAPPDSPFYTPDGSFNHEFLENTKEIQKSGWKIVVLGIGTDSAAKEIAKELSAGYSVVTDSADSSEISKNIDNFLGILDVAQFPAEIKLDKEGNAIVEIEILSTGYNESKDISVLEIQLFSGSYREMNILKEPFEFRVEPEKASKILIPVVLPLDEEEYEADLIFIFGGENAFTPAVHHILITMTTGIPFFIYYLLIAVVVIIIIFYSLRIVQRKRMEDKNKPDGAV
jgi:hypothetical protein